MKMALISSPIVTKKAKYNSTKFHMVNKKPLSQGPWQNPLRIIRINKEKVAVVHLYKQSVRVKKNSEFQQA